MRKASYKKHSGFTLVEVIISMALLAFVCMSFNNVFLKIQTQSGSLGARYRMAAELHAWINDLQADFQKGVYISNNSSDQRLEYTTYDSTGAAVKKIYSITTISGRKYLQLSTDGGTSWGSPYAVSAYTRYSLVGTPKFLYAWSINNCTDFVDSDGDGVWASGTDAAGAYVACSSGTSVPTLNTPSQATKVILQSFQFDSMMGVPSATRTLQANLFIPSSTLGPVISSSAPASPAVKDSPLVHSFATNTANSLFGTAFGVRQAFWDAASSRLIVVGRHSSGNHTFFLATRQGVLQDTGLTTSLTTIQADSVASKSDNCYILLLDATAKILYTLNTQATSPIGISSTLNLGSPSNLINTPTGIAYDPATPNDFYIVGTDPATSALKIYERNTTTGALVGSAWTLPAAFDASHPPGGLAIEPLTGDFLVVRNYVNGSAPNHTIDIYRMTRAGSNTSFSVNIDDLGSTATGTTGNWGIGYDAVTNRLFLSDSATNKVYEVIPSLLITSR